MEAADFKVDVAGVRSMGEDLRDIYRDLLIVEVQVSNNSAAVGDPGVARELEEFASNWDRDRETLMTTVKNLSDFALGAADAYDTCERELSSAYDDGTAAMTGGGSKGAD